MNLVERAQRRPERIGRFVSAKERLAALTPEDVRAMAARYLEPGRAARDRRAAAAGGAE